MALSCMVLLASLTFVCWNQFKIRLCAFAWCFPDIPAISLHIEANEMPLDLRRRKLVSQYFLKVSSMVTNQVRSCIFNKRFIEFFDKNPNQIRPLGCHVSGDLSDIGFVQKLFNYPPFFLLHHGFFLHLLSISH